MNPLPKDIKLTEIDGNWQLVAADFFPQNSLIGLAFIEIEPCPEFKTGKVPLVLGAYLTHSENPNCMLQTSTKFLNLWVIRDLFINHTLTIDYRLYYL